MKPLLYLTIVFSFAITSCNTLAGVGRDLQSVGNTMTKTAEKRYTAPQGAPAYYP